jgi:hypothetical protein
VRPPSTVPGPVPSTEPPGTALPAADLSDLMSQLRLGTAQKPTQD